MIDDPISNPRAWYVMKVGATPTPGKCEVTAERVNRINVLMGLGSDGASTVYVGREVIVAQATFWAWQTSHFTEWDPILAVFKYDPARGIPVRAVDIYHPALADLGVRAMLCKKISTWKHEGKGLYTRVVELVEYKPVPKTAAYGKPFSAPGDETDPDPAIRGRQGAVAILGQATGEAYK
jgi:hypothetical protein